MQELRLVAVSEDGTYLVLAGTGRGTRFMLPVDDRLRAAVRGQFSRLGQYEIEVENPLRPKEIQARIRAGETAESIAQAAGIPVERVRWFESPVLQEREYMARQAQLAPVRRPGEAAPGPALGDLVAERIGTTQLESGEATWDSWKREDNTWQVKLSFRVMGEEHVAHWIYEPRRRSVTPYDEEAVRFSAADDHHDAPPPPTPHGATVTPFAPRRSVRDTPLGPEAPEVPEAPAAARPRGPRTPVTAERAHPAEAPVRDLTAPDLHHRPDPGPPPAVDPHAAPSSAGSPAQRSAVAPQRPPRPEPPPPAATANSPQQSRRKGRGRRASVPSWDEIMFGSKKSD
ncbi:MAG TPA: septation protein SepH [Thermobifida alba]|nr:septation protein SepH [Thermobifida alba]